MRLRRSFSGMALTIASVAILMVVSGYWRSTIVVVVGTAIVVVVGTAIAGGCLRLIGGRNLRG